MYCQERYCQSGHLLHIGISSPWPERCFSRKHVNSRPCQISLMDFCIILANFSLKAISSPHKVTSPLESILNRSKSQGHGIRSSGGRYGMERILTIQDVTARLRLQPPSAWKRSSGPSASPSHKAPCRPHLRSPLPFLS